MMRKEEVLEEMESKSVGFELKIAWFQSILDKEEEKVFFIAITYNTQSGVSISPQFYLVSLCTRDANVWMCAQCTYRTAVSFDSLPAFAKQSPRTSGHIPRSRYHIQR